MVASVAVGVVGFLVALELDYPFVGLAVYWAGILAFFAIWKGTSVQLYDERDYSLERRASLATFQIAGAIGLLTMTALVVVREGTTMDVPDEVVGGFLALSGLFVLYGVVYTVFRYRR